MANVKLIQDGIGAAVVVYSMIQAQNYAATTIFILKFVVTYAVVNEHTIVFLRFAAKAKWSGDVVEKHVMVSAVRVCLIALPLRHAAEEHYHHSLELLHLTVAGKLFMTEIKRCAARDVSHLDHGGMQRAVEHKGTTKICAYAA